MSDLGKEILLCRARLADKKKRLEEMELRADSYIGIIRDIIDPYAGDFTGFDMDKAMLIMTDFHKIWKEARELKSTVEKMERDLNG